MWYFAVKTTQARTIDGDSCTIVAEPKAHPLSSECNVALDFPEIECSWKV